MSPRLSISVPAQAGATLVATPATAASFTNSRRVHVEWFADKGKWEGLACFGVVESVRELDGKTTVERRYYLSSLKLDAADFARAVRGI